MVANIEEYRCSNKEDNKYFSQGEYDMYCVKVDYTTMLHTTLQQCNISHIIDWDLPFI